MPRKLPAIVVPLLLLTMLLTACGAAPSGGAATAAPSAPGATEAPAAGSPAPAEAGGATLRIGRTAGPDSLNPGVSTLFESGLIYDLVYDTLIRINLKGEAYPGLAREWSVAEDGRTWTFRLAEGAMWHDGQPVTAEDVKFTYEMIKGFDAFALLKDYTSLLESVEAPDPTTAVITFEQPVANTDERFAGVLILPRHIWEAFPDAQAASEFENSEMVGSGPFRLAEFRPGEFTRLTAVKDHYASPPKIDAVIFQIFGNGDALIQALRSGEIDMGGVPSNTMVRSLQADPKIKLEIGNNFGLTDIIFNIVSPENCPPEVGKCTGHPALRDVRVRQALAHATDKQALIDGILLGLGSPGLSLVTPAHGAAFASEISDNAFDVAQANQILDEAGYADTNGDGVRELPGDPSRPLSLRYSYPSDQYAANGPRFFELLRDQWKQAGVELTLSPLEADALVAISAPAFDFDVVNWGWRAEVDPASLLSYVTTEQIPSGNNETGYANPELDQLYQEQLVTVDRAKRQALIHQIQAILVRDVPYIIPYYAQVVAAYRADRFQGWAIEPDGLLQLSDRLSLVNVTPAP